MESIEPDYELAFRLPRRKGRRRRSEPSQRSLISCTNRPLDIAMTEANAVSRRSRIKTAIASLIERVLLHGTIAPIWSAFVVKNGSSGYRREIAMESGFDSLWL
jgi:hypothetical protein